jgi:murein DD-endopeptidase MepM/ murein hydrolase activator NlpD
MNPVRQIGVCLLLILFAACLIQMELFWIEDTEKNWGIQSESDDFSEYQKVLESVWTELVYFPVPVSDTNAKATVAFENSWQARRTYGGERLHEGTDLMASINTSGYYPVVSMTDGTVEQIGWLEKGGWRIGIRSENGNYYYYAHLHSYAREWTKGETVKAGELLAYMGDTGYGPEGTTGQFPVHLHVGIYVPLESDREMAVNPYWMLKYLENQKLTYSY